jgi:hypothetical protein
MRGRQPSGNARACADVRNPYSPPRFFNAVMPGSVPGIHAFLTLQVGK